MKLSWMDCEMDISDITMNQLIINYFILQLRREREKMNALDITEVMEILSDKIGEYFQIDNEQYYIVCTDPHSGYKEIIIHGYGTKDKPYQIIIPRQFEDSSIKEFVDRGEFIKYLRDDLKRELVVYQI